MEPSVDSIVDTARYLTERASQVYNTITFNTDGLYNEPAPEEWVSFMIGGIFSAIGLVLYYFRYTKLIKALDSSKGLITGSVCLRAMISALIDNDDSFFTIVKLAAQSFLFLGGLQYNYEVAFSAMLGWFAMESTCDTIRILTAFREVDSIKDLMAASSNIRSKLRSATTQLKPTNVYEDISRGKVIVTMVFITQCLLISFVVADIYDTDTHSCHDGTPGCPVVGTLGSWTFYVLGIFMASVFLLGPRTSFGQSEQNPSYWIQLLVCAKKTGSSVTWYDPVTDQTCAQDLSPDDWRVWLRFMMSFLINGVGFHILVHALPIQVATQSSLTGVVFRAVGMMYLVDLDDTPGYTLTVVEKSLDDPTSPQGASKPEQELATGVIPTDGQPTNGVVRLSEAQLSVQAQAIIENAHAQLDALASGKRSSVNRGFGLTGAFVMAGAVGGAAVGTSQQQEGDVEALSPENGGEGYAAVDDGVEGGDGGGGADM